MTYDEGKRWEGRRKREEEGGLTVSQISNLIAVFSSRLTV
jgi:hypothetical protein